VLAGSTGDSIRTSARCAEVCSIRLVINMTGLSCRGSCRRSDDAAPLATSVITANTLNTQIAGRRNDVESRR